MASLFNTWLVSGCEEKLFSLYLSWIRGRLPATLKAPLQQLPLKTYQKWFLCYLWKSSFKIFVNVFPFLYVKANSRKFVKKCPLLFIRRMLMSAFLFRFKANYLEKCVDTPIFFMDSNSLAKIYFFCRVLIWRKNLCIWYAPSLITLKTLKSAMRFKISICVRHDHFSSISERVFARLSV